MLKPLDRSNPIPCRETPMSSNGEAKWDSNFASMPDKATLMVTVDMMEKYIFGAFKTYGAQDHQMLVNCAAAINGILECLEKGIPVQDGIPQLVVLNQEIMDQLLTKKTAEKTDN